MTSPQPERPRGFHFHVYFHNSTEAAARALYEKAQSLPVPWDVGRFHPGPIGPHPTRQFQLRIEPQHYDEAIAWLEANRGELDVFYHPEVEDDYWAHTEGAAWLGRSYALRLECFDR